MNETQDEALRHSQLFHDFCHKFFTENNYNLGHALIAVTNEVLYILKQCDDQDERLKICESIYRIIKECNQVK